jgi:hypothetical protein
LWKKEKISLGTNVHENKKKKQSTKIRQNIQWFYTTFATSTKH